MNFDNDEDALEFINRLLERLHQADFTNHGIGYHYVIRRTGEIEPGRPAWMVGAHCLHHNAHSIGVCYEGGYDARGQPADTRTEAQKAAMRRLLEELHQRYPRAMIVGHRDLNPAKKCPGFPGVAKEYWDLQPR